MEIIIGLWIYNLVVTIAAIWWGTRTNSVMCGLLTFLFFPLMIFFIFASVANVGSKQVRRGQYNFSDGTYYR
ncbi:hypothetical protein [Corynebacterium suicordis]|uniref:TMhelix containing protein n=1 Tax=Corynebacterium suicordis DSM 45110 TaxID=1121369 RepID=A0ABR9ZLX8_9CORY|nr:hypothetical protein [Corynebacterium suicordis]MBF4554392.1 hypothetical protein [Corynebacterium suicordis DSM 45110]MDR6278583.1 Na+/H+-dicarboxylate symporter [Corynebacterium suicordis]